MGRYAEDEVMELQEIVDQLEEIRDELKKERDELIESNAKLTAVLEESNLSIEEILDNE